MKNIYLFLLFQCLNIISVQAQVWTPQNVGIPNRVEMFNISAPDSKTVWVSGFLGIFYTQPWNYDNGNTTVALSNDVGLTWQQSTIDAGAGGAITSLYALDNQTAWATCIINGVGGKVFKTTNGGANWTQQTSANFSNLGYVDWIYFWDANEGICLGDAVNGYFELFRTTNGGNNWSRLNIIPAITNEIGYNEIYQVSGDTIWFQTSSARIIRSVNRGISWSVFSSGQTNNSGMAFSKGKGLGVAFPTDLSRKPYSSKMIMSQNGGESWSTGTTTPFSDQAVFDATIVPETDYIVVSSWGDNAYGPFSTYLSRDKGMTWTQIDNTAPLVKIRFVNPRVGYGGGHKTNVTSPTTLYRYTGSPLTGLLTPSVLDANISLSPNPTTDQLNIQLAYKESSNFRLNINNLLGDLVYFEDFKDVSNINKSLNIKQFPSGTYIVTIANPTGSLSRKIVKTE